MLWLVQCNAVWIVQHNFTQTYHAVITFSLFQIENLTLESNKKQILISICAILAIHITIRHKNYKLDTLKFISFSLHYTTRLKALFYAKTVENYSQKVANWQLFCSAERYKLKTKSTILVFNLILSMSFVENRIWFQLANNSWFSLGIYHIWHLKQIQSPHSSIS